MHAACRVCATQAGRSQGWCLVHFPRCVCVTTRRLGDALACGWAQFRLPVPVGLGARPGPLDAWGGERHLPRSRTDPGAGVRYEHRNDLGDTTMHDTNDTTRHIGERGTRSRTGCGGRGRGRTQEPVLLLLLPTHGGGGRCGGPLRRASPRGAACGGQGLCSLPLAGRDFRGRVLRICWCRSPCVGSGVRCVRVPTVRP